MSDFPFGSALTDKRVLDLCARVAWRGAGNVEPNPLVGAAVVQGAGPDARVIGVGHHRRYGDVHAEVDALRACAAAEDPRGGTMYVTLEPCAHQGKQPPCVDAILAAGIARVVIARRDPNPVAMGGADRLQAAGIEVEFSSASRAAIALSEPFIKRVQTGLPWVIAKWAQTIDGKIATRTGESKWISCEGSRRRVHRLRARVDAIVTAIGTVLADDPALTARGGWVRRKVARRVVIDPGLETPEDALLVRTVAEAPLTIVCADEAISSQVRKVGVLTAMGVEVLSLGSEDEVNVEGILRHLVEVHQVSNVMIEAGPGLIGRMLDAELVDEMHVYIAPKIMADELAKGAARGRVVEQLAEARVFGVERVKRIEDDVLVVYRREAKRAEG